MKQADVMMHDRLAGILTEDDNGFTFCYHPDYLKSDDPEPISLTFPLKDTVYVSKVLFPFFDGLIPEGWLLEVAERSWKINTKDRMALLLSCCKNCIGAVSIRTLKAEEES